MHSIRQVRPQIRTTRGYIPPSPPPHPIIHLGNSNDVFGKFLVQKQSPKPQIGTAERIKVTAQRSIRPLSAGNYFGYYYADRY